MKWADLLLARSTSRAVALRALPLTLLLSALAAFGGLSGCGDDTAAAGCTVDADCRGARMCVEGACVDSSENNANNADNNANNQSNNANNASNNANNASSCAGDDACEPGTVCDRGECMARPCAGNADCGQGRFCYADLCYPTIACNNDAPCAAIGGTCQEGQCVPGCVIDGDCPDPQGQRCVDNRCVEQCTMDTDCGLRDICEGGVCTPAECMGTGTNGCPQGERCEQMRCVPYTACEDDGDCPAAERCDRNICEPRQTCIGDANCGNGQQCIEGRCYDASACERREDCGGGLDCVGGFCVPYVCRGNDECAAGEVCEAGVCEPVEQTTDSDRVVILTPSQTILPGQELELQAVVLRGEDQILSGYTFAWTTSVPGVAAIDADGVATGGDSAGTSEVRASVVDGAAATSEPITLRNPGAPQPDMGRVIVVDGRNGSPLSGATVVRGADTAMTDANGVATFAPLSGVRTISVYSPGFNYLTVVGTRNDDLLLPLRPARGSAEIGGFKGDIDLSQAHTMGDITVGLAGASLDGELANLDLATLLGDQFATSINIPGLFDGEFPLPGGIVLYGTVFGFPINIKQTYYARSTGGLKVGWSFGGKINANDAIGLVGGGDAGAILPTVLAFFEAFDHGLRPVQVVERPQVADTNDIDGDGDRAERIPDYNGFPTYTMRPNVQQRLRTSVQVSDLPIGGDSAFAILVGGVINQGIGFVPLGINVSQDENGDGSPEPALLKMAPPHSGLTGGNYAIVAITFDPNEVGAGLDTGIQLPDDISTIFWQGRSIPADYGFGYDFLPIPSGSWSAPDRTFSNASAQGATLFRATFINADASWDVFFPADGDGFDLPAPPEGFSDWAAGSDVQLQAFLTRDGVTLDSVTSASGGTGLHRVSTVSLAFSRAALGN